MDDLLLVRRQLDSLASMRLETALGQELDRTYQTLCHREQELLGVSIGVGLTA